MNEVSQTALTRALYKMLRPLVRLLMRHGVSYRSFADVARHVYVDVAEQDFPLAGRKPSHARTAVLTGINRKDIAKLKGRPHPLSEQTIDTPTPAARVITAWLNDRRFHDQQGQPRVLAVEQTADTDIQDADDFTGLVREYSSDVPVRALLDELLRIGAVEREGECVRLAVQAYVPLVDTAQTVRIFSTAATDLLRTMDHNIAGEPPGLFLQRTVSYNNIPEELLNRIRERSRAEGEAFLLQVNEWLAQCDREENKDLVGSGRVRAGIGIYYLEHPAESEE